MPVDQSLQSWDAHRDAWQRIVNGREIPARHLQRDCRISVDARIEWERDGVEVIETIARAWSGLLVLVDVPDVRVRIRAVWLHCDDVTRR